MTINRELWAKSFTKYDSPIWRCSGCKVGVLELQKETLQSLETADSLSLRECIGYEIENIDRRFTCLFKCNNKQCLDVVSVCGKSGLNEVQDDEGEIAEVEYFMPKFFYPAPLIFEIPEACPENIAEDIHNSFSIFWYDCPSAANKVRVCIEKLLDHKKVKKTKQNGRGKRVPLSLNKRIEELGRNRKYSELADNIMAIKWLGNAGSHVEILTKNDLLDGYEILEHVLNELYIQQSRKIAVLTKAIIKKKGPR